VIGGLGLKKLEELMPELIVKTEGLLPRPAAGAFPTSPIRTSATDTS